MRKKAVNPRGYKIVDDDGNVSYTTVRIRRPITDPEWNRRQMGTHERMSKKERLKLRKQFREAVLNAKKK